jgi:SAM-dependent methyltransferase
MNYPLPFNMQAELIQKADRLPIHSFPISHAENIDAETVASFGEEWSKFNSFSNDDVQQIGRDYFDILPKQLYSKDTLALDAGCGTGRWASYLAPNVGFVECIDPSEAVHAAAQLLYKHSNVRISRAAIDTLPFPDDHFDLVYSLGVLHHIPDTFKAMQNCVAKVKEGGYFLVYLYYNLDNRGAGFKALFSLVNAIRSGVSRLSPGMKKTVCDGIAFTVYYPLAKSARLLHKIKLRKLATKVPLSYYSDKSFYIMKNDALDRFGTPLEQRFSKAEIIGMMERCGLKNITVSPREPYWHAIGQKG